MSANIRTITCPHCLTDVKHGANICTGCRAEIRYGLSIGAFFGYYVLTVIAIAMLSMGIGYLIENYGHYVGITVEKAEAFVSTFINNEHSIYYVLGFTIVVYAFIFFKYIRKAYRDHISFVRKVEK